MLEKGKQKGPLREPTKGKMVRVRGCELSVGELGEVE